jgi:acyl carrier protein
VGALTKTDPVHKPLASGRRAPGMERTPLTAAGLQVIVEATLRQLHAGAPGLPAVTLDSRLDRDLGFDSLARTELLLRIEQAFGIRLPDDTLQRADTVGDLLDAARHAHAAPAAEDTLPAAMPRPPPAAGTGPAGGSPATPAQATTLVEVLEWHLREHPQRIHITCIGDDAERAINYHQLAVAGRAVAAGLQRIGVQPRDCVAIMLPTSPEYFSTYVGILLAGAIPVPIYPPARASQIEEHVLRHAGILDNARAVLLVTVPEAMAVARLLQARVGAVRQLATPAQLSASGGRPAAVALHSEDIAFIQYTSGSTGDPKGVALTHANLLANIRAMAQAVHASADDVFVSWLPLYHDMGLIGAWLGGLYVGYALCVMSPLAFLARPERWLQAVHRHRGSLSAAPNFAYELCVKRITDEQLAGLDLSCWRVAFNGAEAVLPDTLQRFEQRFARCGLRPGTVLPVYGLAEAGLGLLFPSLGRAARIDRVQRDAFAREHRALPAAPDDASALRFVGCGVPLAGYEIRLLDKAGRELGERVEGRLQFRGPSATAGYYRNPQQTARLFSDGWLDTGDRAYCAEGEFFITGRVKDIIIRGGRNLYPQEIETAVGTVAGVRQGCVAVFGSTDTATGTERLVVLAETHAGEAAAQARLRDAVARAVVAAIGEPPDEVLLVPPHSVLKTSSGKVRRSACKELYEAGTMGSPLPTARRQVWRLAAGAVAAKLQRMAEALAQRLFGLYAAALFWTLAAFAWPMTIGLPRPALAWRANRRLLRILLRLTATPLRLHGIQRLPAGPCVLVCNHGSYLDGMILIAALPRPFSFVAKAELRRHAAMRQFLQRLGTEFVDRFDAARGVADTERLSAVLAQGRSLILFPEGTFGIGQGLLPFHLGAFLVAARASVPVLPVVLRGQRAMLPDGTWLPRRGTLELEVCDALSPPGNAADAFAAAVALRDAAQGAMSLRLEAD